MRAAMRRLQRLENKKKRDRRVVFRFHLNDGRVVDSAKNELPETSHWPKTVSSSISAKPTYTYESISSRLVCPRVMFVLPLKPDIRQREWHP